MTKTTTTPTAARKIMKGMPMGAPPRSIIVAGRSQRQERSPPADYRQPITGEPRAPPTGTRGGGRAGAEGLAALRRRRGLEARVLETGGGPAVFGERRAPGATRTVLIYCH